MFTAGDSVVGIPSRKSGLISKIGALLPQYSMDIAVSGKLGVRMFVLRSRLDRILKAEVPDVVILYSDSDLSNQNEDPLSIQEKFVLREHYRANFTLIVEAILATNAKLALSGIECREQQGFPSLLTYLLTYLLPSFLPSHTDYTRYDRYQPQ